MAAEIPKIIHYCWFGGKPLPEKAKQCIRSWRKFCPDYEIKEWNEKNYDLNSCDYIREAYQEKKWAFVSDYARFDILYRYGGLYFDTDVELIQKIDDIVKRGPFMGNEISTGALDDTIMISVATGLGIGAPSGLPLYKEILDFYHTIHFSGTGEQKTVVEHITGLLEKHGYEHKDEIQEISDVTIYPHTYFSPLNNMTGKLELTPDTRSIHHYDASWMNPSGKISIALSRKFADKNKLERRLGAVIALPFRFANRVRINGLRNTLNHIFSK